MAPLKGPTKRFIHRKLINSNRHKSSWANENTSDFKQSNNFCFLFLEMAGHFQQLVQDKHHNYDSFDHLYFLIEGMQGNIFELFMTNYALVDGVWTFHSIAALQTYLVRVNIKRLVPVLWIQLVNLISKVEYVWSSSTNLQLTLIDLLINIRRSYTE